MADEQVSPWIYNRSHENDSNSYDEFDYQNPESFFQRSMLTYYLMGIGAMLVCCLGIIGNILSAVILSKKTMRSSTYSYLFALAICDMLVLFFTMLLLSKDTRRPPRQGQPLIDPSLSYYGYMFPIVHPIIVTFQVTSVWLTVSFTVDRYIMICHPFSAERMCSVWRARIVIAAISIGGVLFNIPRFLEYQTETFPTGSMTLAIYQLTAFGQDPYFRVIVHSWLYLICVCGLPLLTLAVLNAFLIYAVHMSRKRGKEINSKEKRRNDTTVMLIGVVVIFFICQVPALIARMIYALDTKASLSDSLHIFNEVSNFLVIMNSAINIVPYYFFGHKFRREFWSIFCCCILTKDEMRQFARTMSFSMDNRRASHQHNADGGAEMKSLESRDRSVHESPQKRMLTLKYMENKDTFENTESPLIKSLQSNGNSIHYECKPASST